MPLDDRLRQGLEHLASDVDPDVDARLDDVRDRGAAPRFGALPTVAAVAVVVLLAVLVAPIGLGLLTGDGQGVQSEAPLPTPTCPPPPAGVLPEPPGDCLGPLEPGGSYRSGAFIPPLDYTIPVDALVEWANAGDVPGIFSLNPSGGAGWNAVFLFRDIAPVRAQCDIEVDDAVEPTAAGMADWLEANPAMIASGRESAHIGGLDGIRLDLAVSGSYTEICLEEPPQPYEPGTPLVPLFTGIGSSDVTWWIGGEERIRLYLLDLPGGGTVTISIDAITTDFEELVELSTPVIETFVFDDDYY